MTTPAENENEAWSDVGTYSSLDEAYDHALVALAMGESIRVESGDQPGEFDLQAEPAAVPKISEELRVYAAESEASVSPVGVSSNWAKHPAGWPYVLVWAITLIVVFRLQQNDPSLAELGASSSVGLMKNGEWWRPFTALFLHADLFHLIGNLGAGGAFFILVSKSIGSLRASVLILLSGTIGNLITSAVTYPESFVSLGASTAGFGALGILSGLGIMENLREKRKLPWLRIFAPLLAGVIVLGWLGGAEAGSNTDVFGHVFGFSAGVFAGAFYRYFVTSETLPDPQKRAI